MRRRIGIYGATDEALQLIPPLLANPEVEVAGLYDPDPDALRERLRALPRDVAEGLHGLIQADAATLVQDPTLYAVIDSEGGFANRFPETAERGVQVVTPLVARLLWCYGATSPDRKTELLHALHEVVESYNLTVDPDELFRRMLEIAIGVTDADGGSLMLLDGERRELRVRIAVGLEPELWAKIRVPIGEGIAGRVVAEARPLRLRGKADRQNFRIVHERLDVESALCVPLIHEGQILGVLNLHHSTRPEAFSEQDMEFAKQLGRLDAQIIARAQEHEAMRSQATRYAAVREVRNILSAKAPLSERLARLCREVVGHTGEGIAHLYLHDPDEDDLYLAASSLEGGGFGEDVRVAIGLGVDGTVAQTREPTFLRGSGGAIAYAALPLLAGDSLVGVLSIQAGPEAPRGRAAEEIFFEIAAAAAEEISAIEREARLQARATKVGAINEAGIRMISVTDPAEVLRLAASSVAMVLEADHAILRLRDEATGRYAIRSYFGSADGRLQEKLFRLDKRTTVDAIKRRGAVLVREIARDPSLQDYATDVRSLMAAPLKRDGAVVGTLAVYDKISTERFTAGSFNDNDLHLFTRFVAHLERALTNAEFHAHARQFRNFDEATGLPNASYLAKRIQEELARAGGRSGAVALATCRIENLDEIEHSRDADFARRVLQAAADALRAHLRDFDVAGRTGDAEFSILLPEPGFSPSERVFALARSVADDISKDDALNEPVRVALAFGYAVHPEEGSDHESLMDRAREARIRMV
jgi:diguanylate cyclase (GGDEF)-like protein